EQECRKSVWLCFFRPFTLLDLIRNDFAGTGVPKICMVMLLEEALGQNGIELIVDPRDFALVVDIVNRIVMGESWTGQFPVKNKMGEQFLAVATNTPFYDDDGSLVGIICVSSNSRLFVETRVPCLATNNAKSGENNGDRESGSGGSHQSEHFSFSEVGVANHREDANSSGASTPRGDVMQSPFGIFSH
ncbi:hypothetical protein S245_068974, partial [Arachis hypogaea]